MPTLTNVGLQKEALARLGGVVGFTYAFQGLFASFAVPLQTEKFYDLAGSLGFITSTLLSAYYPQIRSLIPHLLPNGLTPGSLLTAAGSPIARVPFDVPWKVLNARQMILSGMCLLWAGRLGSFLAARIAKHGSDTRFDEIKKSPPKFAVAWFGQATWITLAGLPIWLVNSIPTAGQPKFGSVRDLVGLGVWVGGMGLEVLADRQKSEWRKAKDEKKHEEKFIKSGVWSWSRHPNYVGEVTLWSGLALLSTTSLSASALSTPGSSFLLSPYIVLLSPLFEYLLLTQASGVPILEKSAEKKWGSTEEWKEYKSKVPVFWGGWPGSKM